MENEILGMHHITAIAGDAQTNYNFYAHVLGLRFVKKTVNFDDPKTYHFYFGNEAGEPGTVLTFFPWGQSIVPGRRGSRMATEIGYSVPENSFNFWLERFKAHNTIYNKPSEKFGEPYLTFLDPDGLKLELTVSKKNDSRKPWETHDINADHALKGFHHITLTLQNIKPTADLITNLFGYRLLAEEVNRYRFITDSVENASIIDLVEAPGERQGHVAGGTIHHVAFRVKNRAVQNYFREQISNAGFQVTEQIDRNYFYSIYFREPGGVLFEIATDEPGFTVDEPLHELGTHLLLPSQYEPYRNEIEKALPEIKE